MIQEADKGSRDWIKTKPDADIGEKSSGSNISETSENTNIARNQFNSIAQARNRKDLKIPEATEALNMAFQILRIDGKETKSEFIDKFTDISEDLFVIEDTLVEIIKRLSRDSHQGDVSTLSTKYEAIFYITEMTTVSLLYASRILKRFQKFKECRFRLCP